MLGVFGKTISTSFAEYWAGTLAPAQPAVASLATLPTAARLPRLLPLFSEFVPRVHSPILRLWWRPSAQVLHRAALPVGPHPYFQAPDRKPRSRGQSVPPHARQRSRRRSLPQGLQ